MTPEDNEDPEVLLDRAFKQERSGDFDAAISVYEQLAASGSVHAMYARKSIARLTEFKNVAYTPPRSDAAATPPVDVKKSPEAPALGPAERKPAVHDKARRIRPVPRGCLLLVLVVVAMSLPLLFGVEVGVTLMPLTLLAGLLLVVVAGSGGKPKGCELCGEKYKYQSFMPPPLWYSFGGCVLCAKCLRIVESSSTPVGDLVAQAMLNRQHAELTKPKGGGLRTARIIGLLVGLYSFPHIRDAILADFVPSIFGIPVVMLSPEQKQSVLWLSVFGAVAVACFVYLILKFIYQVFTKQ